MARKKLNIAVAYAGINADYQDQICKGILDTARLNNYNLAFFAPMSNTTTGSSHDSGEEKIFDLINFDLFDAFIIMPHTIPSQETLDRLVQRALASKIPTISIDIKIAGCHNIQLNYCGAFSEIMEHLISKHGFREINYVGAFENERENDARFSVYRQALRMHGISFDKSRVLFAEFNEFNAIEKVKEFLESGKPLPQAFVCANDNIAIGVCDELARHGIIVPDDVVVTGFDGIQYGQGHLPSLTTVEMAFYQAGENAVKVIPDILRLDRGEFINAQVKNKFVLGESCGCVKMTDRHMEHNQMLHSFNTEIDRYKYFSKKIIRMGEDLTQVNSLDVAFRKLVSYIDDIYVDRFYLCLNTHVDQLDDKKSKCDVSEYSDTIDCRICREHKEYLPRRTFGRKEVLPALFEDNVFSNIFFITPLHFHDRNYGYIAISCDGYEGNASLFNSWKMNVSTALENIRVRSIMTEYAGKLERMYVRDPLTNLLNRRGMLSKAEELFENAKSRKKPVFVLTADLDNLKTINDKYGHCEGDNAIMQVGNALNRVAKHRELCARFGGDEFNVMAFNYSEEFASAYVNSVEEMLEGYNSVSEKPYNVSASCGYIIAVPSEEDTIEDFIRLADAKMYENKKAKKMLRASGDE